MNVIIFIFLHPLQGDNTNSVLFNSHLPLKVIKRIIRKNHQSSFVYSDIIYN